MVRLGMLFLPDDLEPMDNAALAALINELQTTQREFSERMLEATVTMQRIANQLENQEKASTALISRLERIDHAVFSVDSERPGFGMRLDRIEQRYLRTQRTQNWILGGGIFAFLSGVVMVYQGIKSIVESGALNEIK